MDVSWTIKKAERWRIDSFELWCSPLELEKTLESPLDCKEIQPVHPKGDQSWVSLEGLMLKPKPQYFGHLMRRADSFAKTLMLGKIGGRRKGTTEDEMVGWHHWLDGHGFRWILGVGDGQGGLACCGSWGQKESDTTERLNWTELILVLFLILWNLHTVFYWGFTSLHSHQQWMRVLLCAHPV